MWPSQILRRLILHGFPSDARSLAPVAAVSSCCPHMITALQVRELPASFALMHVSQNVICHWLHFTYDGFICCCFICLTQEAMAALHPPADPAAGGAS